VCEPADVASVQEDLRVEVRVQLGVNARILQYGEHSESEAFESFSSKTAVPVLMVAHDVPTALIQSFDLHVVFLTKATILILAVPETASRILNSAPHLRSRLTDVFRIQPERREPARFEH
jgi:hypothetical protein